MINTIFIVLQFFISAIIAIYFLSLIMSQKNSQKAIDDESKLELEKLNKLEKISLTEPLCEKTRPKNLNSIIGQKEPIKALIAALCGPNPQHVIIYGPPGVGKTAAARLILERAKTEACSPFKSDAKFIETDATTLQFDERSIADPLIGSVHDPIYQGSGAYGNAGIPQPKKGAVSNAHGGILFIDEIGELHPVQINRLLKVLEDIELELKDVKEDYNRVVDMHRNHTFAFSRLGKEMELINAKLSKTEEKLDQTLRSLASLKEDEKRAREQLDEIKKILKQSKSNIKSYKLPVTPKNFYVELGEASEAIGDMITELDKRPISIKTLNTRVDTARDLTLKVYNTTKESIKTAKMAETAIVYGNRYKSVNKDVELGLIKAENAFFKGNFKLSLEQAISAINVVEPGIHKRLIEEYKWH